MYRGVSRKSLFAVFAAALILLFACIGVFAAGGQLVSPDSDDVEINYEVDPGYVWVYDENLSDSEHAAWRAGNSYINVASVSNIAISVTGAGQLTYEYKLSTPSIGTSYVYYYNIGSQITSSNYSKATNYSSYSSNRGNHEDWRTETITINNSDLDADGKVTVYAAYLRNGPSISNNNYVAISNVKFVGGEKSLTLNEDSSCGNVDIKINGTSVTSVDNVYTAAAGSTITLTASPAAGFRFYGWIDKTDNVPVYMETNLTYSFQINKDITLEAKFAPVGTYSARRDAFFYTGSNGLYEAINEAESGQTVVMLEDQTIPQNVTLKNGTILLIPCMDCDPGYIGTGDSRSGPDGTKTSPATGMSGTLYSQLTIPSGVTMTVKGTVLVNAVVGRPSAGHADQDITGGYGKINLAGNILVDNGGMFENYGIVDGSGQVTAKSGGSVVDLYVVRHWRGGSLAMAMVFADNYVYPMNETDCHNIMSEVRIESGGSFIGAVKMYASGEYHKTHFPQIDNNNGLIRLNEGAYVIKTYNKETHISTIDIYGGATFSESTLNIVGMDLSTSTLPPFPIDGDIEINMSNGEYIVSESFKLLTGGKLHLASDATLTVNAASISKISGSQGEEVPVELVLYDEFHDKPNTSTTQYPERDPAVLTVDGGSTVNVNGVFAGRVATGNVSDYNPARFIAAANAVLKATTYEANGYNTNYNDPEVTIPLNFKAELWSNNTLDIDISENTEARTWVGDTSGWIDEANYIMTDLNRDGTVDSMDLNILLRNYNKTGSDLTGDFNSDNTVDDMDLNILLRDYDKSVD